MEIFIKKEKLEEIIKRVDRAIEKNPIHFILSGMLFEAEASGKKLKITGGSEKFAITTTFNNNEQGDLEIIKEGRVVIPAQKLLSIVKKMPEGEIRISKDDERKQITISSNTKKTEFVLYTMDASQYPRFPKLTENVFTVNGEAFADGLDKTVFASLKSDARPQLNGINVVLEDGALQLEATDAHRLAVKNSIKIQSNIQSNFSDKNFILPEKSAKEIIKLIKNESSDVKVYFNDNFIIIETKRDVIFSKLIKGSYPNVRRVIPEQHDISVTLEKKKLLYAIERANILAEYNNTIMFEVGGEDSMISDIKIYQKEGELGKSTEFVSAQKIEGIKEEVFTIAFNADYVLDALKHIEDELIILGFVDNIRPFSVIGEKEGNGYIQVIMPVRP